MRKKVRTLMVGSYLLVLMVVMLIYMGVRHETERRLRDVYIERQLAVMEQAVMGIDGELEAIRSFCLRLSQDPYVQLFSFADAPLDKFDMENVVKLVRNIRQTYTENPFMEDFYIYYESCGRVANSNSFFRTGDYYRQEWSYQDKSEEQWTDMLKSREHDGYLPVSVVKNGARQGEYITYVHRFGPSGRGKTSAVAALLKKSWLDEKLEGITEGGQTIVRPDAREDVTFYFGEPDRISETAFRDLWTEEVRNWRKIKVGDTEYLATRIQSDHTGWLYESLLPYEAIMVQMKQAIFPLFAGMVLYGMIGVPICIFLALKSYEPIKMLTGHIGVLTAEGDGTYDSELDYIYSGITTMHQKYREMELKYGSALQEYDAASAKLKKNRERIQEGILLQLIGGHWRDEKELKERLAGMDITFPFRRFCVMIVRIEKFDIQGQELTPQERALTLFILKNVSRELLDPAGKVYPVSGEMDQVYLLVNLSDQGCEEMKVSAFLTGLLERLKDYMMKSMKIHISVGAGTVCAGTQQLNYSFKMAQRALDYCFISGKSSVIVYDAIEHETKKTYHFDGKLEKNIRNALARRDSQMCAQLLDETYQEALRRKITVNEGKQLHIFMTDLAMKAIAKSGVNRHLEASYQDMVEDMLSCETLPEVIPILKELLRRLCCEQEGGEEENALGRNAAEFIQNNYWKSNFSLQMCADEFRVTPEHLSRTIKTETGHNFMEIVNRLRMERAKYYLASTDEKMEKIADLCGYGTAKSFFRSFKQSEGMTPGAWRKKNHR